MPREHVNPVALIAVSPCRAAAATGLRQERIAAAIKSGELHAFRVGTKTRILASEIERWIMSHDPAARSVSA